MLRAVFNINQLEVRMRTGRAFLLLSLVVAMAGCDKPSIDSPQSSPTMTPAAAPTAAAAPDWSGRWTGVEGMVLDVTPLAGGRYKLAMRYDLDHLQTVEGRAQGDGIAFERDGRTLVLRPTDGAATGLKYLAGKRDCLTVASGEGYCRG